MIIFQKSVARGKSLKSTVSDSIYMLKMIGKQITILYFTYLKNENNHYVKQIVLQILMYHN